MCPVFLKRCISSCLKSSEPPGITSISICITDEDYYKVIKPIVLIPIYTLHTVSFIL